MKFLLESTLVLHHGRPRTRVPKVVQEPNSRPRNTKGNTQPELGAGPPIVAHLLGRAGLLMVAVLTLGAVLVWSCHCELHVFPSDFGTSGQTIFNTPFALGPFLDIFNGQKQAPQKIENKSTLPAAHASRAEVSENQRHTS